MDTTSEYDIRGDIDYQEHEDGSDDREEYEIHMCEYMESSREIKQTICKKNITLYTQYMSKVYIQKLIITSILELSGVALAFFIAYSLRLMRDWIPFVHLSIPYISYEQFVPFVISGVIVWCIVFIR